MPINRFFSDSFFTLQENVEITDQELHHFSHVVRTKEGEVVELVNGKGQLAEAVVARVEKKAAILSLKNIVEAPLPTFNIILAMAIPRINRLETILEKGTELGVGGFIFFPGIHSEKKDLSENQLNRLTSITVGALKQSGRLYLPGITFSPPLKKWTSFPEKSYFGDVSQHALPLYQEWTKHPPKDQIHFFVGPESGFAPEELKILAENHSVGVSLNENILRTDTAAICALSILSHLAMKGQ